MNGFCVAMPGLPLGSLPSSQKAISELEYCFRTFKSDDLNFIETIVREISRFSNVRSDDFTIMGSSNGAALTNQIAIESDLPNIRNYITGVSLNVWQYDGRTFKAKGKTTPIAR